MITEFKHQPWELNIKWLSENIYVPFSVFIIQSLEKLWLNRWNTMCSKLSLLFGLVLFTVFSSYSYSASTECSANFCNDKKYPCPLIQCVPGSVPLKKPELCRCCHRCYRVVGEYLIYFDTNKCDLSFSLLTVLHFFP